MFDSSNPEKKNKSGPSATVNKARVDAYAW